MRPAVFALAALAAIGWSSLTAMGNDYRGRHDGRPHQVRAPAIHHGQTVVTPVQWRYRAYRPYYGYNYGYYPYRSYYNSYPYRYYGYSPYSSYYYGSPYYGYSYPYRSYYWPYGSYYAYRPGISFGFGWY